MSLTFFNLCDYIILPWSGKVKVKQSQKSISAGGHSNLCICFLCFSPLHLIFSHFFFIFLKKRKNARGESGDRMLSRSLRAKKALLHKTYHRILIGKRIPCFSVHAPACFHSVHSLKNVSTASSVASSNRNVTLRKSYPSYLSFSVFKHYLNHRHNVAFISVSDIPGLGNTDSFAILPSIFISPLHVFRSGNIRSLYVSAIALHVAAATIPFGFSPNIL